MRFITTDDEQRSELRIPREDEFDGAIKTEERLEGRLRLPATDTSEPESGERPDQYTFMQVLPPSLPFLELFLLEPSAST